MIQKLKSLDKQVIAVVALIFVAAVWGATFVVVADAVARYPIFAFLAMRFLVATIAFIIFFPRVIKQLNWHNLKLGLIAGLLLSTGYIFQTLGLLPASQGGTTAARTAFLTGMYVVIVPIAQSFIKKKIPAFGTAIGMVLALVGLAFLSEITLDGHSHWVLGDTWVLISAFAYSAHMILLGHSDEKHNTLALTFIQLAVVTLVSGAASGIAGEHSGWPHGFAIWFAILLCGLVASAFAFVVQTWAQRILPPSRVALILISEPALGGIFGWAFAGSAPIREVIGAILMLAGMVTSESMSATQATKLSQRMKRAVEGIPIFADDPHKKKSIEVDTTEAGTVEVDITK